MSSHPAVTMPTFCAPMGGQSESAAFRLGDTPIYSRVMLAPMAGVTDRVFRQLVRRWAPDSLVCTEMLSSNGLVQARKARKRRDAYITSRTVNDHPIAYQLAAHELDVLLEAAEAVLQEHNPVSIDLNMGCPVKKITGNFEGCALMKTPEIAQRLIAGLVRRLPVPITVKFRLGWDISSQNYLEFGRRCEDAGARMVTLHARTRSQGYAPGCRWEAFGELKQALGIPVIANGDIRTASDALHVMQTYGVDGVMIGRAALGEPWLVGRLDEMLRTGQASPLPLPSERFAVALEHASAYVAARDIPEERSICDMRKHLAWYAKDFAGASNCRRRLTQVASLSELEVVLSETLQQLDLS